jgi:hypothetical protein
MPVCVNFATTVNGCQLRYLINSDTADTVVFITLTHIHLRTAYTPLYSLKQVHDIASLNLLEGGVNPPLQLPLRIEAFHRFLLYRLHKELSTRPGSAAVDTLYGHDVTAVNKFVSTRRAVRVCRVCAMVAAASADVCVGA